MTVYLSTLVPGIGRAQGGRDGAWSVDVVSANLDVRCLTVDPHQPSTVWAGTHGAGVWKSSDAGLNFVASGLDGAIVKSLAVSPATPERIYAGVKPAAVFFSEDGGMTWSELRAFRKVRRFFWISPAERPFVAYVHAIAISPKHPDVVVAGIEVGAVVRSTDGGRTWEGHRPGSMRDCHSLAVSPDGTFFEGGYGGGARSADGGQTWSRAAGLDRRYGWAVAADPAGDVWYLSSTRGVEAHSDRADAAIWRASLHGNWERLAGGLPDPLNWMPYALIAGPEPGRLVAGLANGEIWETHDRGDSWSRLPLNLPRIERAMVRID